MVLIYISPSDITTYTSIVFSYEGFQQNHEGFLAGSSMNGLGIYLREKC